MYDGTSTGEISYDLVTVFLRLEILGKTNYQLVPTTSDMLYWLFYRDLEQYWYYNRRNHVESIFN